MVVTTASCRIGSGRIVYDRAGSGPTVVFLHGIGGNRSNWAEQLAGLGSDYTCVAWDAMGYGGSGDSKNGTTFEHFADELTVLLDDLDVNRVHLVGLSMGGLIAQSFYSRHPDRVATLTLAATSVGFGVLSEETRKEFIARRLEPLEKGMSPAQIAESVVEILAGRKATSATRERLRQSLAALRKDPYMITVRAIVNTDFRPLLSQISVPTFVVVGEDDRVIPPSESAYLAQRIPGARFSQLREAGHLCNIEAAEAFNTLLREFLDRNRELATALQVPAPGRELLERDEE